MDIKLTEHNFQFSDGGS